LTEARPALPATGSRELLLRFALERRLARPALRRQPVLTLDADPADLALLAALGLQPAEQGAGCALALGRPARWSEPASAARRASELGAGAGVLLVLEGIPAAQARAWLGSGFRWQRPEGRGLLLPEGELAPGLLGALAVADALLCGLLPWLGRQVLLEGVRC
jgi:hypothetical protein